jgi:hypothetical protein
MAVVPARVFRLPVLRMDQPIRLPIQEGSCRMNSVLRVAVAALALSGAMVPQQPMANAQKDSLQPACVLTVPSGWGEFKGASHEFGLAFQDSDGTLRFVRDLTCEQSGFQRRPPAFLEVRRK